MMDDVRPSVLLTINKPCHLLMALKVDYYSAVNSTIAHNKYISRGFPFMHFHYLIDTYVPTYSWVSLFLSQLFMF